MRVPGPSVARSLETGVVLGVLSLLLAATGLLLSPTVAAFLGLAAATEGTGNRLYAAHMAAAILLVAFVLWHLWPYAHAFSRKAAVSLGARAASFTLLGVAGIQIATGYVLWAHDYRLLPKATAVVVHLAATFVLLPPLTFHALRGWRTHRARRAAAAAALAAAEASGGAERALAAREAVTRRVFLRVVGYAVAGVALALSFGRAVTEQVSAWRINSVGDVPALTKENWRLRVTGLVERPLELSYDELIALGPRTMRFTHHCVEGWTYTDDFTGVPLPKVLALAGGAKPGARTLILKSAEVSTHPRTRGQTYTTNFPYEDALHEDVLLVHGVGDADLSAPHGGPVRLMTPRKWGYKACKWLTEIEVSGDAGYRGYWERLGYHNDGDHPGPIFQGRPF